MRKLHISFLVFFASIKIFAHEGRAFLRFTENKGQWQNEIRYRANLDGGALFLTKSGFTYHLYDKETLRALHIGGKKNIKNTKIASHAFDIKLLNCNEGANTTGLKPGDDYTNYFIGSNPEKWKSNIKSYQEVNYSEVYKGIDLQVLGNNNSIKYNFIVKPHAKPANIQMAYRGLKSIKIKNGELLLENRFYTMRESKPFAYQNINGQTVEINCRFALKDTIVTFSLPNGYNENYDLIIDPTLVFAASSGSTADNFGMTATYDTLGNLYSGGTAFDIGFPTTPGVYDPSYNGIVAAGRTDVVITKYDANGAFLQYSTYIGGALGSEIVTSIIVDKQNNLFLYGATGSTDFPTTPGCFDNTFNGGKYMSFVANGTKFDIGTDIYVAKLNPTGSVLLGSTYVGGSENDGVNHCNDTVFITAWGVWEYPQDSLMYNYGDQYRGEIQLDKFGDVYIASSSRSSDFPTANAFDNTLGGTQDGVIFKMDAALNNMLYGSFIGGSNKDAGYSVIVDDSLNAYVAGGTASNNFPIVAGAYSSVYNGGKVDGYIIKVSPTGNTLKAATFFGTNAFDQCYFIQSDQAGDIYVYGNSLGAMPITQGTFNNPNSGQFISKFSNNLSTLIASTRIGNGNNSTNISPSAFLVDCSGNIYLSGWGGNIITGASTFGMPITPGAIQSATDGFNFYLAVLAQNMTALRYATYFGGNQSREHVDGGTSRFDKQGIIYQSVCAGCGGNDDFPVTPGAWPSSLYGTNVNQAFNCNNGTFKIDFQLIGGDANFTTSTTTGCSPLTITFNNISTSGFPYLWDFGGNDTTSTVFNPTHTFTTPGTYTVNLYVISNSCYNLWDTAQQVIIVKPTPTANFTDAVSPCALNVNYNDSSFSNVNFWSWNFGTGASPQTSGSANPGSVSYSSPGTYTTSLIVGNAQACFDTIVQTVMLVATPVNINVVPPICTYESAQLLVTGANSYTWTPSAGLNNTSIANPIASPSVTTTYSVQTMSINLIGDSCYNTLSTTVTVFPEINADFNFSINPCGNTVLFTDTSYNAPVAWWWNFGDGQSNFIQNPSHAYSNPGTYPVTLAVQNFNGCVDTIVQPITVAGFTPSGVFGGGVICPGDSVMLVAYGGVAYNWSPSLGLNSTVNDTVWASPDTSTTYSVQITTITTSGDTCYSIYTSNVTVSSLSAGQVSVTADQDTIELGSSTNLHGLISLSGATFSWQPTNGLTNTNTLDPTASPSQTTTYNLLVTDASGCSYLVSGVTIYVIANICDEGTVYLPNAFTPNGDGMNDVLYVRSNFITEVYLTIYDRWGENVFETNDIKKGWDGTYKGKKCDPAVYGYYMKVKCNNGEESFKKGNISLIR